MGAEGQRRECELVVREFCAEDAAQASEILLAVREAASWSSQGLAEFMMLPGVVALISERGGKATGFVLGRMTLDEAEVLNLAVRSECRRQGEGRALLEGLLRRFVESGVSRVFLEVRESNRVAMAFYERQGFRRAGRREDYYRDPREAALVFQKNEDSTRLVPNTS
jgi:[ribosomal protein S18]-alanine N-acetyltransferase